MRPTPIPDDEIWEGGRRLVVSPPGGDLTNPDIAPVEAIADRSHLDGVIRLCVRIAPEAGDLEKLAAGGHVWVAFYGAIVPFALDVKGPGE